MKKLLNTLYITRPNAYLRLDGENIVIEEDGNILGKLMTILVLLNLKMKP